MSRLDAIISDFKGNEEEVYSLLVELQDRRESDIIAANKYLGNSQFKQLCHITSELIEVWIAWLIYKWKKDWRSKELLNYELVDLQSSCQTMIEGSLKINEYWSRAARQYVIMKNKIRHYDRAVTISDRSDSNNY